jgi:hypothetical protein
MPFTVIFAPSLKEIAEALPELIPEPELTVMVWLSALAELPAP